MNCLQLSIQNCIHCRNVNICLTCTQQPSLSLSLLSMTVMTRHSDIKCLHATITTIVEIIGRNSFYFTWVCSNFYRELSFGSLSQNIRVVCTHRVPCVLDKTMDGCYGCSLFFFSFHSRVSLSEKQHITVCYCLVSSDILEISNDE